MNVPADIAAVLLKYPSGKLSVGSIESIIGLTTGTVAGKLTPLVERGIVRRDPQNMIHVLDAQALKLMATQADPRLLTQLSDGSLATAGNGTTPKAPTAAAAPAKPARQRIELVAVAVKKGVPLPAPRNIGRATIMPKWDYSIEVGDCLEFAVPAGATAREVADQLRKDAATVDRIKPPFYVAIRVLNDDQTMVGLWRIAEPEKRGAGLKQAAAAERAQLLELETAGKNATKQGKKK